MSRKRSVVLAGLALAVTSLAAAAPAAASAATPRSGHEVTRPLASPGGPMVPGGARTRATSANWSGYAAGGGTYKSVSAKWVQPRVTCSRGKQLAGFWVGLDGATNGTVEQTGDADVCRGSHPSYYAWYEMFPHAPHNYGSRVKPGDHMSASVNYTGGGHFTLKISDATQHWSHTAHGTLASAARSSAEVIIEAPCCNNSGNPLPLAHFANVRFTHATVDGAALGHSHPVKITMVDMSNRHLDSISALSGGNSFSGHWLRKT